MDMKRKHIALAVSGAIAFMAFGGAHAQQQQQQEQQQDVQRVERIEVTGSNIKRVDTETVAPVDIITREQIERSGQPTIAEVLRNVPANSGNSYSESFTNSFAPGASGLSLRGLGQKTTLVLINGRRTAGYGFAQNLQDTFVDLNSIPSSAVERIEVLKDGASAIYGSDAIAGVVNVILRRDYKGVEIRGRAGTAAGNGEHGLSITGGFGDIGRDKFSLLGVLDYYKRDIVMLDETDFGESRDMRGRAGGRNHMSVTGAGTWRALNETATAFTNNFRAISGCQGTVLTTAEAWERGLIFNGSPLAGATDDSTFCARDFNSQFTAIPKTERLGFLGRGTFDITPTIQGFAEVGASQVKSYQKFQSPFFAGTTGLRQTADGLRPFTYNITFAPGASGNPFDTPARYLGVLNDLETRDNSIKSDTYRLLAGIRYSFGNWDGETAMGWARNQVSATSLNVLRIDHVSSVFGVPSGAQPPTPVSTGSVYNLDDPASNSDEVRAFLRSNSTRRGTSEMKFIDTRLSTTFGELAGGPIGVALGAEFRSESLKDRPSDIASQGLILGQSTAATDGSRDNFAAYAEASLPVTKAIEAQAAVRFDHYSDYGNSVVPKLGVKWNITPQVLVRANWGKGFRAPTLPEISPSTATFFTSVRDTDGVIRQISGVYAGNPNLDAEKSTSATLGLVYEPTRDLNLGLTWYLIDWRNQVGAASFQSIVNGDGFVNGVRRGIVTRDPDTGYVTSVESAYYNYGKIRTDGLDIDANYRINTLYGRFGVQLALSYLNSFKVEGDEFAGQNGFGSLPRLRGSLGLSYDRGPFSANLTANYIHRYRQELLPDSWYTPADPRFQTGTFPEKIKAHTTFDLFGSYEVNSKLKLNASVLNVFNRKPPYDPGTSGTFLYDFTQYDARGRAFRVGFTYKL